ncbi:MAG TPA: phosphoribosyltransferase family protein [Amnibacterium sp.]|nr:phosphoribosyltransferase family protein [Amnibacterium sp.]
MTAARPPIAAALRGRVAAALGALQELVLPVPCTGCGSVGPPICRDCGAALAPVPALRRVGDPPLPVWSGLAYEGVARSVLLAFKNEGRTEHGAPLAIALRAALDAALPALGAEPVALVPMPATIRSSRDRGYDPVRVVLRRASLPPLRLLRLERRAADQRVLGRDDRLRNVAGSMRSRHADGMRVVLVDDVVTTGATLTEAACAVRAAGGTVLGAITVASTSRRSARS